MSLASEWQPGTLPSQATLPQPGTSRIFEVNHDASGWRQKESETGVFSVEHQLGYVVGSGNNGLTFLIRRGSYLFQAPLSFYSKTKKWDFSPGYESVDLGFNRVVPQECINCHSGRSAPLPNQPGAFAAPFPELAIGCENCHGPGSAHVRSLGKRPGSIVNPAKLPPRLAENICMNCHQSGDARVLQPGKNFADFQPGEWLFDTAVILRKPSQTREQQESDLLQHFSAMQASRCFRASNGKLSCLSCHDPHVQVKQPAEVAADFRGKCFSCHNDRSCSLPLKARLARNPPDDCAGCHMPKRNVLQVSHSALTNHRIPAREGEPVPPILWKQFDDLVVVNAPDGRSLQLAPVTMLRAYGQLSAQDPEYGRRYSELLAELNKQDSQDPVVQSALGHEALAEDKPEEAISHLKAASMLDDPAVDLELGQALAKLARHADAIEYLKKSVQLEPYDPIAQKTLILEYINTKNYPDARLCMERYVENFPEDSFMRGLLARVPQ